MNEENETTNPFEDAESNASSPEDTSEYVDFGTPSFTNNQEDNNYGYDNSIGYENDDMNSEYDNNEENYYDYQGSYSNQDTFSSYNNIGDRKKNTGKLNKAAIIIIILILIGLLIFVLKSLLGVEEPTVDSENTPVEINNNEESVINKKYSVDSVKLASGNILIDINNKNNISVDAEVIIEYYDKNGDTINNETINIKNIPDKHHYYELVTVKPEFKELEYSSKTKLSINKFKDYYQKKIEITNKTEEEEKLLVEVKNDSYSVVDVIEVYVVYYDEEGNTVGFDNSLVKKLAVDKVSEVKLNYPKDKEYNYISFSRYEVGVNTAYSYRK